MRSLPVISIVLFVLAITAEITAIVLVAMNPSWSIACSFTGMALTVAALITGYTHRRRP